MNARIIPMTEAYRDKLVKYMHIIYPEFTDSYIQFDVNEAINTDDSGIHSLIVVNENDDIVGCHLVFITKAWMQGKEHVVGWGHNTYLDEEYRRIMGIDFVLEIASLKNCFGYSLTDVNTKIHKKMKGSVFVSGLFFFRIFTPWVLLGVIFKLIGRKLTIPEQLPNDVKGGVEDFRLCKSVDDIKIPNNGYWYQDVSEIDFIRNHEFLNRRFFENPVNKYYVYSNQDGNCYFVIRPIVHNGLLGLLIADFRHTFDQPQQVKSIFKAVNGICSQLHIGVILLTTSERETKNLYEGKRGCKNWPLAFVCSKKKVSSEDAYVIINGADSDGEFHL